MSWYGVITNSGKTLLSQWGDHEINVCSAAAGTGTVAATALLLQTALLNQMQSLSIVKQTVTENGRIIKLRASASNQGYTCNQIGVWARLDDASPVLLAILQSDEGQPVPSAEESPEFIWTFNALLEMSNAGEFSITVDLTAAVTLDEFNDHTADQNNPHAVTAVQVGAVATEAGKGLYPDADKTKLAGIETNANNYVHPTTTGNKHIPAGGAAGQILKYNSSGTAEWGAGSKHTARFTVGTSTSGYTATDVDYLCDGTADDVEINAAIQALPAGGGEIVILDGVYNLTDGIVVNKVKASIRGNGNATILKRMYDGTNYNNSDVVSITADDCKLQNLYVDGNYANYPYQYKGIMVNGNRCVISGVTSNDNGFVGIYISVDCNNNIITGCVCRDNDYAGVYVDGDNNIITGNTCIRGTGQASNYTNEQYTIFVQIGDNNLISSNNCMGKSPIDAGTNNVVVSNKSGDVQSVKTILVTEPFNSVVTTVVNLGWKPALVTIDAVIRNTKVWSKGTLTSAAQYLQCVGADGVGDIQGSCSVVLATVTSNPAANSMHGIATLTSTGLEISWTKNGTPPGSGDRRLIITAFRNID